MERSFAQAKARGDCGGGQLPASQVVKQHAPDLRFDPVAGNLLRHLSSTGADTRSRRPLFRRRDEQRDSGPVVRPSSDVDL